MQDQQAVGHQGLWWAQHMTWHDMQQSVGDDKHSFVGKVRRLLALHQTLHRLGRGATVAHQTTWPERTRTDSSVR